MRIVLALLFAGVLVAFFAFGGHRYLSFDAVKDNRDALLSYTQAHYAQAMVVAFVKLLLLGLALSVPLLLRLRRRFGSWRAPMVALVVFGVVFAFSTLVVGPAIRGEDGPAGGVTTTSPVTPSGHEGHH